MSLFNYDYSTLMLFRCIERKYAEGFCQGEILFGTPRKWINIEKAGNKGRGDLLEGVFLSLKRDDNPGLQTIINSSPDVEVFENNGFVFYRKESVLDTRCLCLYGLHDNSFVQEIDGEGRAHYKTRISRDYFSDFSDCKSLSEYKSIKEENQPVVVFIKNPNEFFRRLHAFLLSLGVKEEEIIIAPVEYVDRYDSRLPLLKSPYELLLKDNSFSQQSEVRIIINSSNPRYIHYVNEHKGVMSIGSLNDITEIRNYYFDDMEIERCGNTAMMMSLPESIQIHLADMSYKELETLLLSILGGYVRLKGVPSEAMSWQEKLQWLADIFYNRYGVVMFVDDNKNVSLYGLSDELIKQSRINDKDDVDRNSFEKSVGKLIDDNKNDEALSLCQRSYGIQAIRGAAFYLSGQIYRCLNDDKNALYYYNQSYLVDYKRVESLDGIASVYISEGEYDSAIKVYEEIQNEKGYDHVIWCNIGICYIHLQQYDKAIEYFDKGIQRSPDDAYAYFNKGVALHKKRCYSEAIECVERAIELDPINQEYRDQYTKYFHPHKENRFG